LPWQVPEGQNISSQKTFENVVMSYSKKIHFVAS